MERVRHCKSACLALALALSPLLQAQETNALSGVSDAGKPAATVTQGTTRYSSNGPVLEVADITNPAEPRVVARLNTGGEIREMELRGSYLYLANGENHPTIIDVSDPANPVYADARKQLYNNDLRANTGSPVEQEKGAQGLHFEAATGLGHPQSLPDEAFVEVFPHPISDASLVMYEVEHACRVIVRIFDGIGNEAATLVNEQQYAGMHTVEWDPKSIGLQPGTYYLWLEQEGGITVRKIVVMR